MYQQNLADFIWDVADVLRGDFKQTEFGRIILPFTVLRRLECVLDQTRDKVFQQYQALRGTGVDLDLILPRIAGTTFYNVSQFSLANLSSVDTRIDLEHYIEKFSANAQQVFEHFSFNSWLKKLEKANLLPLVAQKFASIDLHPNVVSNRNMGIMFEHLIRKFAESANDTAGEFFTPRDVVRLATTLIFAPDHQTLNGEGVVRTVYDCAAGTGGFLSSAIEQVSDWNPNALLVPYAQELNPETYAISLADKLTQGFSTQNIKLGNTLSNDMLPDEQFDYCLANPPFGVKWEKVQKQVQDEHKNLGYSGRFGAGLPRIGDGSLLFLMHLLSKRKPIELGGSRIGIVLSGSPMFNGGASSGESEIRRWILENDWLEAIIALPNDLFYNTGISTYIWVLSNHKEALRKGKVQLIDATATYSPMRKSLGSKRKFISEEQIAEIAKLHKAFEGTPKSKLLSTTDFGYRRITVERPLRLSFSVNREKLHSYKNTKGSDLIEQFTNVEGSYDNLTAFLKAAGIQKLSKSVQKAVIACFGERDAEAQPVVDNSGNLQPDSDLREFENIPLSQSIDEYFAREVLPHAPDAWIDTDKADQNDGQVGIIGYEINFNRYFHVYQPPRPLSEIDAELKVVEREIAALLGQVIA